MTPAMAARWAYHAALGCLTGTLYQYYKGDLYRLLGVGTDSTNSANAAPVVAYYSLTRPGLKVRRESEWRESVAVGGVMRPRFQRIRLLDAPWEVPHGG